jgi:hypothetical protein
VRTESFCTAEVITVSLHPGEAAPRAASHSGKARPTGPLRAAGALVCLASDKPARPRKHQSGLAGRELHRVLDYSGNVDNSFGSSSATNFSISPTDQNALEGDLPNDIATSWSGSTEITGVTPDHPESFNVQAASQWTIKVVAAQ